MESQIEIQTIVAPIQVTVNEIKAIKLNPQIEIQAIANKTLIRVIVKKKKFLQIFLILQYLLNQLIILFMIWFPLK